MAYVRRRRRGRRAGALSGFVRARLVGIMFLAIAGIIFGAIAMFNNLVPSTFIVIEDSGISVGSRPDSGSYALDIKILATLLGVGAGIFTMVSGIRRLGVKI
ncbi:MAG: hypothetical protein QXG54_06130 [Desulfurococcaceae archaeon]